MFAGLYVHWTRQRDGSTTGVRCDLFTGACIQQEGRWDRPITETLSQPGTNTDYVIRVSQQSGRQGKVWRHQMRVGRSPQEGRLPYWAWVAFLERPSAKSWAPRDRQCPSVLRSCCSGHVCWTGQGRCLAGLRIACMQPSLINWESLSGQLASSD